MRAGVLVAVLLLAACAGASPSTGPEPVRILAANLPWFDQPYSVSVIQDSGEYLTGWQQAGGPDPAPEVDFATEVVIYLGMAGSSSCPETFQHLVVDAEAAHVFGEWDNSAFMGKPCTDDLAGQGIALAVSRAVLPPTEFRLTLREELVCPDCPDHPDQAIVDLP
jgi:hypothetical protein